MSPTELSPKIDPSATAISPDASIVTAEELEQRAESIDTGEAKVFETSGTQGDVKRIPYAHSQLPEQRYHEARAFEMAGLESDDVVMTLGAPLNSISGWASRSGSRELGAEVLNRSFDDYRQVIEWREADDVTATFATPLVAKAIGEEIEAEYGPPSEIFPNMRLGFMFGDLLPDHLRASLKRQWGFDELRSLYGSVEADVMAITVDETQQLVPMINKLVIEVLPEESANPTPVDIRDVTTETTGPVLISDPNRDLFSFTRYRIGDIVTVIPGEIPRLKVMGREDDTINLGGAPLYEQQIHAAVLDTYGTNVDDWSAVVSRPDVKPAVDVYVVAERDQTSKEQFREHLFEYSPPVREACEEVGTGIIEHIQVHETSSLEVITTQFDSNDLDRDLKASRIIFDDSYFTYE
jgi:phenylacetate-coenzyme A ligase PaaK-like adenylate-forming protein